MTADDEPGEHEPLQARLDEILALEPRLDEVLVLAPSLDEIVALEPRLGQIHEFPHAATPFGVDTQEAPTDDQR
ncbi:hypothetical protein [Nocardia brasiliensis]|uniref:Uncharacterized protein n=1 Tax=Nocardia brasiliensis (strain ATCC 700358 / HUJEG-1) TaxID=1133849 RepID=K0F5Z6_NOCB7|nr:hypothetical protein [Nocardia brasiliensis]AFU02891.1 hypothetical protein O3I_024690 [Nocardia brasiliensis ATCC 700358]OCF85969.1 hypothetical protein AW168_32915 [Nocardia brasiliensis]